jgi:hypothetical protein
MPKLAPFELAESRPARKRPYALVIFFLIFTAPLFVVHLPLLDLPFYWDELGQFVPTALDLLRTGAWVAHSTIPNVHPPGVEAYLVIWYKLLGFSIPVTRVAMLLVAGVGLTVTFLLAIELSKGTKGAPAFIPPILLLASPLFFTQSMMAQLDMPAMVFTVLALLLFIKRRWAAAATVCVALVLIKETGLVVPLVFFGMTVKERNWRQAAYFAAPAAVLAGWLLYLHSQTGNWLGDAGFAHYNVEYSLHPVRIFLSLLRRIYYLLFAEFRWIGTLLLICTFPRMEALRRPTWRPVLLASAGTFLLVTILGGAELERYLLPVLPIFYIAVSVALTYQPKRVAAVASAGLLIGLAANLFWNPPYPFPYENNLAMVDYVRLQQQAADVVARLYPARVVVTAWPYSAALRDPDFGYVPKRLKVVQTADFHPDTIRAATRDRYDVLITFTRTWVPENKVMSLAPVQKLLGKYYEWQPDITSEQCAELGLSPVAQWNAGGQQITVYAHLRSNKL